MDQDTQTKVIVCDTCYDSDKITGGQYPCGCSGAKYTQDYQFGSCCYSQEKQGPGDGYQFGGPYGEGEICRFNCPPSRQPSCQIDDCQAIGNQDENCQVNRRLTLLRNQCDDLDSNDGGGDQLNLHNQLIFNQYNNVIGSVGNCEPSNMACQIGELARNLACGGYDNQCCRTSPGGPSPPLVVALPRNNQCSPRDQIPQVVQFVASRPQPAVSGCPVPCTPRGPNSVILANTCFPTKGQPFVSSPQGQIFPPNTLFPLAH
ncbi:uncharacterized protein [Bemisia tabaci]|uniref:uncharacterized protein n=1 Tax=Bemisia tabaci TaxID=7038 RepID=UPI003B286512